MPEAAQPPSIMIVGAGAWGTTLALLAHRAGASVTLIAHRDDDARTMAATRRHPRSLPGIAIPEAIRIASSLDDFPASGLLVVAIPTQKLRVSLTNLPERFTHAPILSVAKGIELGTLMPPSAVIAEALGRTTSDGIAVLSGPNLASEIAEGMPAAAVVAGADAALTQWTQRALGSSRFRLYTSNDPIGVELGGALKNIIAIGAGIADGLALGDNAKAAFITRGLAEITRLGIAMGADPLTFGGLSGIGDLLATCASTRSRNHRVGEELAAGRSLEAILADMQETAEGVATTRAARDLAARVGVEMPITEALYGVLFAGTDVAAAIESLLVRTPAPEVRP
ncbi:MAG: NAD(P)H-dependent glycerol-3-phosphate dehydrogenase [Thermomicrobiales bacterium]